MKLKNVVLIGVVASIMAYLNNNLELDEDDSRMENLFEEVKNIVSEKLNHFDIDSRLAGLRDDVKEDIDKAKEVADEISDTLISELNEAVDTILNGNEEPDDAEATEANEEMTTDDQLDHEDLIRELESLLAEVEGEPEKAETEEEMPVVIPKLEPFTLNSDDDYQGDYPDAVTVIAVDRPREIPKLEPFVLNSDDDRVYYDDSVNVVVSPVTKEDLVEDAVEPEEAIDEEPVELFDEDEYLKQIQEAIENTLAVGEDGQKVDMSDVFDEEKEITNDEIDEIFSEIIDQENEPEEEVSDEYLESLLNDLKEALPEIKEEETVKDVYAQINDLYPYLSRNFVRAVYDLKEPIATEYPLDANILILHRLSFDDLDDLRQFTEIVLHHDYRVNVDEKQMIVDIFKECKNTDGKILTNIFEIANQAKLLNGNYEGYRVEVID